jgi:hypothetical protein
MKYTVQLKQINGTNDPANAQWIDCDDVVSNRTMATAYAEVCARDYGTPCRVITVREFDDESPRLVNKVIAYFGPVEHAVEIDWVEFSAAGCDFRTDVAQNVTQVSVRGSSLWTNFKVFVMGDKDRDEFYKARSKAIYGR